MKSSIRPIRAGFSLMEMLVVISIIILLAGLTFGGFAFVKDKQARSQAEIQVKLLENALVAYHADNGEYPLYPRADAKGGTSRIFNALYPATAGEKVYLTELNPKNDTQGWLEGQTGTAGLKIYDPWGNEYYYRTSNPTKPDSVFSSNHPDFDLWSAGPDGKTTAGAGGAYDPQDSNNKDDIRCW
jgi:prepilin-type N-terminal cleavage/methylation domain-containing protein